MSYHSNTTLHQIGQVLRGSSRIVVTTHAKPDGDALGSVIALCRALERMGKTVEPWVMPPLMESLRVLTGHTQVHVYSDGQPLPMEPDRIVVVDTGAWSQLDPLRKWIEPRREKTIVIDHHLRGDDVGASLYVDAEAAATAEIIADLIDDMGVGYDLPIANALYVGIASDTGWFRFSNCRPRTHELAARLMRCGVDHAQLYITLEQAERHEKLALIIRALDSLQTIAGGRAAIMTLRHSDFKETGARMEETERLVDIPQVVQDVQVVVLLTEMADGSTRFSFRSKPGDDAVDVNEMARHFGGGGHARAAGAKTRLQLDDAKTKLIAAIESAMGVVK
jgi:phosphoesterase RecJ-like protein